MVVHAPGTGQGRAGVPAALVERQPVRSVGGMGMGLVVGNGWQRCTCPGAEREDEHPHEQRDQA